MTHPPADRLVYAKEAAAHPGVPEVLTGDDVADLLQVSKRTVERLRLPSVKLGRSRRYLREDVLNFLREKAS